MPLDAELKEKFPRLVRGGKKALRNPIGSKIMPEDDLVRFVDAQAPVESHVLQELAEGQKRTHWMWFIFPQLSGLGFSPMAQRYGIRDIDQARRYLAHPILGNRLRHDVRLMLSHKNKSALEILGSPLSRPACLSPIRLRRPFCPQRSKFLRTSRSSDPRHPWSKASLIAFAPRDA